MPAFADAHFTIAIAAGFPDDGPVTALRMSPTGSPAGKHGAKAGVRQNAGDFRTLVTLNLDTSFLYRASGSAGLLHFFGECFFFGQTDADKSRDDRHRLAAAMRGLT